MLGLGHMSLQTDGGNGGLKSELIKRKRKIEGKFCIIT